MSQISDFIYLLDKDALGRARVHDDLKVIASGIFGNKIVTCGRHC